MDKLPNKVKIVEDVLAQDLEREAVLLNLSTEHYYGLDEVGQYLWKMFSKHEDVQFVYETMLKEYDVTPGRLEKDMILFIKKLSEAQLIVVS